MEADIRAVLANPDAPDEQALVNVICDEHERATIAVACLAPIGSFAQVVAALSAEMPYLADGWERHTDELVSLITNPRYSLSPLMSIWADLPDAVGALRDRTSDLVAWAQRVPMYWYHNIAVLLGPSEDAAMLLAESIYGEAIGHTLRLWSMATDPDRTEAWRAQLSSDVLNYLYQKSNVSVAFPAWGVDRDNDVDAGTVVDRLVFDLENGWDVDYSPVRGRIGWLERHIDFSLAGLRAGQVGHLAIIASLADSDKLASAVCERVQEPAVAGFIVGYVPFHYLHSRIRERLGGDGWDMRYSNGKQFKLWNPYVALVDLQALEYASLLRRQMRDSDVAALNDLMKTLPRERRARFEQVIKNWAVA